MLIYKAVNTVNGSVYIGQTTKTLHARKVSHWRCRKDSRMFFSKALNKYGKDAFHWEVLHLASSFDELNGLERTAIEMHRAAGMRLYNTAEGGVGCRVQHTPETRKKLSLARMGNVPGNKGVRRVPLEVQREKKRLRQIERRRQQGVMTRVDAWKYKRRQLEVA